MKINEARFWFILTAIAIIIFIFAVAEKIELIQRCEKDCGMYPAVIKNNCCYCQVYGEKELIKPMSWKC
jgi:hypothetical protein